MKPIPSLSRTLALTVPAVAITIASSHGASDYFLKIEGIKGESIDSKHRDSIEIASFSWGATNSGGLAKSVTLNLGKKLDKSSPLLFLQCAKGNHIPKAILTCRKSGSDGSEHDYYVVTFSDILVSSYQSAAGGGGSGGTAGDPVPTEQISFNYEKIKIEYTRVTDPGEPKEEPVVAEHDFSTSLE